MAEVVYRPATREINFKRSVNPDNPLAAGTVISLSVGGVVVETYTVRSGRTLDGTIRANLTERAI